MYLSRKLLISFLLILLWRVNYAQPKYDLKVVAVGIGEKNQTFNESNFPNIEFYYTPGLLSKAELDETGKSVVALLGDGAREIFEGTPELLAKWWDDRDLRSYAILFDRNGVGAWQGKLRREEIFDNKGKGADEDNLEDAVTTLIEDEEFPEFDDGKEFDYEEDDCLLQTKMPDFEVTSARGDKKSIKNIIENGKTTLFVFFQISKDVDVNAAQKSEKSESLGSFLGGLTQSAAGVTWSELFKNLEFYIYNNDVKL